MLKGGMLLTYSLGVQNRATQDIDFLVKGFPYMFSLFEYYQ